MSPEQCVFVDDLRANVDAAARLGMVAIHHTSHEDTAAEFEARFGIPLAGQPKVVRRALGLAGKEEQQAPDGVTHHHREQRDLPQ